jgi:hypothetical protein
VINSTILPTAALARPYPSLELRPVTTGWQSVATDAVLVRAHVGDSAGVANAADASTAMAAFRHSHAAKQAKGNAPPRGTPR